MRTLFLLFFACVYSFDSMGFDITGGDSCITDKIIRPLNEYRNILKQENLSYLDSAELREHYADRENDTSAYIIYCLLKDKLSELLLIRAKMAVTGGKEGDDFYILEKTGKHIKKMNFFTGYLDCIIFSGRKSPDIIYFSSTDHGKIKVQIVRNDKYYHRKKIVDVYEPNLSKIDKKALLKKYNAENESHEIRRWEEE